MRQFFNSLVSLFRGQTTAMDYNKHAHARYMVCRTADKLTFGTFQPQRWEIPLEEITELYSSLNEGDLPACSNKPILEVSWLWPLFLLLLVWLFLGVHSTQDTSVSSPHLATSFESKRNI